MECLLRPVMSNTSFRPAATASSTTYWIAGLSMTGSISLGVALVAGKNLVPSPAAGITALVTSAMPRTLANPRESPGHGTLLAPLAAGPHPPPHPPSLASPSLLARSSLVSPVGAGVLWLAVRWRRARGATGQGSPPHPAAQSPVRPRP